MPATTTPIAAAAAAQARAALLRHLPLPESLEGEMAQHLLFAAGQYDQQRTSLTAVFLREILDGDAAALKGVLDELSAKAARCRLLAAKVLENVPEMAPARRTRT